MTQYISKSALVAEIEKLQFCTMDEHMNYYSAEAQGEYNALSKLESFLDTLEVKEVDLESNSFYATVCKIGNTYLKEMDKDAIVNALDSYKDGDKVKVIIIKEQKPTCSEEDKEMIDKIVDFMMPMPIFFESTKGKSGKEYTKEFVKKATKWLKSLKERLEK